VTSLGNIDTTYGSSEMPKTVSRTMPGWSLEDVAVACWDNVFYDSVAANLDVILEDDPDSIQAKYIASKMAAYIKAQKQVIANLNFDEKRARAVIAKYYYSGACARWFCQKSAAGVVEEIQLHVDRLSNSNDASRNVQGDKKELAINHLWTRLEPQGAKEIVSLYAARALSMATNFRLLDAVDLYTEVANNESLSGWVFQTEFFSRLLTISQSSEKIIRFTSTEKKKNEELVINQILRYKSEADLNVYRGLPGTWFVPLMPRHAGYDAACLDKMGGLMFLQLTVGSTHSLKEQHLMPLLNRLTSQGIVIQQVEMMFVLKVKDKKFSVPASMHVKSTDLQSFASKDIEL